MPRPFRVIVARTELNENDWKPRELRHSFVSLLSSSALLKDISRLVGHTSGGAVTKKIYRKQIRPILLAGAKTMDGPSGQRAAMVAIPLQGRRPGCR